MIDSAKNSLVLALESYVSRGGGYRILTLEKQSNGEYTARSLVESATNTIMHFGKYKDFFGLVTVDFEDKAIRTKLVPIDTAGGISIVPLPLDGPRKFLQSSAYLVVEGVQGAYTEILISIDGGINWKTLDYQKLGHKDVKVLFIRNEFLYLVAARSFTGNNTLLKLNLLTHDIEEIKHVEIDDEWNFFMPISRNKNLYAFVNGQNITLCTFEKDKLVVRKQLNVPKKIGTAQSMFVSDGLYVLTAAEPRMHGKVLSWTSSDSGEHWAPYKQKEGFRLVYNTVGRLFMINFDNDFYEQVD